VKYNKVDAKLVNKNLVEVNNATQKKGNLIPRRYLQVSSTMLSSQDKWNNVFSKFIEKIDELLENNKSVKEVQRK
jgi:hypothetical protein